MKREIVIDLIYKKLDGHLSPEEERILNEALLNSHEIRNEYENICNLRSDIRASAIASFQPGFEQKILEKIEKEPLTWNAGSLFDFLFPQFRKVAFSAVAIIFLIFTLNISSGNEITISNAFAIPEMTLENLLDPTSFLIWGN